MRNNSLISATAGGTGNSGNLVINSPLIVAVPKENSDIIANAFEGRGGRIDIATQGIFGLEFRPRLTPLSDITASSDLGVQGTVTINRPDIDPNKGLTAPPTNVIDTSGLIVNSCIGRSNRPEGKFIITGNGGLPVMPDDPLVASYQTYQLPTVYSGSVSTPPQNAQAPEDTTGTKPNNSSTSVPIVVAKGWIKGPNGEVILTADAPSVAPNSSKFQPPTCPGS